MKEKWGKFWGKKNSISQIFIKNWPKYLTLVLTNDSANYHRPGKQKHCPRLLQRTDRNDFRRTRGSAQDPPPSNQDCITRGTVIRTKPNADEKVGDARGPTRKADVTVLDIWTLSLRCSRPLGQPPRAGPGTQRDISRGHVHLAERTPLHVAGSPLPRRPGAPSAPPYPRGHGHRPRGCPGARPGPDPVYTVSPTHTLDRASVGP